MEEDEFDVLSQLVADKSARAGVAFQLGASHMSGQICLSRIRRAARWDRCHPGALPDWLALSPSETQAAVERMVATADPVPVVLYNPPHAKTVCSPGQLAEIANALPGVAGVKVAGEDAFYRSLHAAAPQLSIFAPGHQYAHARRLGAVGSYSNVACLEPVGALAWERQMDEDPDGAEALGRRIMSFFDDHMMPLKKRGYSDTALDKTLAAIGGWTSVGTRVRWPYAAVPDEDVAALTPLARSALPELFR